MLSVLLAGSLLLKAHDDPQTTSVRYLNLIQEAAKQEARNPGDAAVAYAAALKIEARDGDVWTSYGRLLKRLHRESDAIGAFTSALKYGGFDNKWEAGIHVDLARCHATMKDFGPAWTELNRGMAMGFRDLDRIRKDKELEPLHGHAGWHELAADADVKKMSRTEGWRYDLKLLNRELRRVHLNPYTSHSAKEFDDSVRALDRDLPRLSDSEIKMRFVKFVRMFGDGHTGLRLQNPTDKQQNLPIQFGYFDDGAYITAADPAHKDLVGLKLEAIGNKAVTDLLSMADEYVARDNSMDVLARAPRLLVQLPALEVMGLVSKDGTVSLTTSDLSGEKKTSSVKVDAGLPTPDWETVTKLISGGPPRHLKNRQTSYWMEYLPDSKTTYFQYNAVREMPTESVAKFAQHLEDDFLKNGSERLVVDCRWNGGGNTFLSSPLVNTFIGLKALRKPGSLFVIMGRDTFSACQNFITDIGRALQPIYVGEPSGSRPNFIGESVPFSLPYSKMTGTVSDLYWERSWPMDSRTWIPPDLPTPILFSDFRAGRDPAMEAIMDYIKAKP